MATNFYPEKPFVDYQKTTVPMTSVIQSITTMAIDVELKRAVYIFFRNESGNGQKGLNNNYGGIQADSGRWPTAYDNLITGVVKKAENQTGSVRYFCAFGSVEGCLTMMAGRLEARGLYVGGTTHKILIMNVKTPEDLAVAYQREWVRGNAKYVPTNAEKSNFLSMYQQAVNLFPILKEGEAKINVGPSPVV